jgi:hypothetical protein
MCVRIHAAVIQPSDDAQQLACASPRGTGDAVEDADGAAVPTLSCHPPTGQVPGNSVVLAQ